MSWPASSSLHRLSTLSALVPSKLTKQNPAQPEPPLPNMRAGRQPQALDSFPIGTDLARMSAGALTGGLKGGSPGVSVPDEAKGWSLTERDGELVICEMLVRRRCLPRDQPPPAFTAKFNPFQSPQLDQRYDYVPRSFRMRPYEAGFDEWPAKRIRNDPVNPPTQLCRQCHAWREPQEFPNGKKTCSKCADSRRARRERERERERLMGASPSVNAPHCASPIHLSSPQLLILAPS